jgi:hypothetical protein
MNTDLNFDLDSFNRALISRGLSPVTAEDFYGLDEKNVRKSMTGKQRAKRKVLRKIQEKSRKANRRKK